MRKKIKFKIHNWKLAVLAFIFIALFTSLGFWQLSRAEQKRHLLADFASRTQQQPVTASDLSAVKDWRFFRVQLEGRFDNEHTFLLDNKIHHNQVGYEVYTPFYAHDMSNPILVDRGFIPIGTSRAELPKIRELPGDLTIIGMLNYPPIYVSLGKMKETNQATWPLRVEYINLGMLSDYFKEQFYPYTLMMYPQDPRAYALDWEVTTMGPERHLAYAVQWFALAITLLILFVALNRVRHK